MAKWINVDEKLGQICFNDDDTFPFGIFMDDYNKMDNHTLPLHWHELLEYGIVLSGKIKMRIDNQIITLNTGDCIFINSNTLHSGRKAETSGDAVIATVCFTPEILTGNIHSTVYKKFFHSLVGKTVHGFKVNCTLAFGNEILSIMESIVKLNKESFDYELLAISKVSELWLSTIKYINENLTNSNDKIKTFSQDNAVIKQLLIFVQENYAKKITIDTLTEHTHISKSECYRYFKYYTGKSPQEYINNYRLSQAEHLLRTTNLSLMDIGLSCGFSGQSYFGEAFKQKYGVSPAKYRKYNS